MIKFVEWLLGYTASERLHEERAHADEDLKISRALRTHAERVGPAMRRRLAENHFGEGITEALHQRGWTQK